MGYGTESANSTNVVFPFDKAAPAARDLWAMADALVATRNEMNTAATNVVVDWIGPEKDTFDAKVVSYRSSALSVITELRYLAEEIARAWAAARGQQDRINHARYVEHEIADDGAGENFVEFFAGEDDYGPPPSDPPIPSSPNFAPTRDPIKPEFEHVSV